MKIQFPAGGAKPGPALAGAGIQMPKFCNAFNDQTRDRMGETVPVVLTIYVDNDFDFVLKFTDFHLQGLLKLLCCFLLRQYHRLNCRLLEYVFRRYLMC